MFEAGAAGWVIDPHAPVAHSALQSLIPIGIYAAVHAFAVWIFNLEAAQIAEEL
jgi:hypothetical protein